MLLNAKDYFVANSMSQTNWSKYSKHYKKEWEDLPEFKNWLSGEGDTAHCKLCKANLRPQLADLKKHANGKKHLAITKAKTFQRSVASTAKNIEDLQVYKKRRLEIRLALQTAFCTSFRAVDSLGTILEEEFGKSTFKMRRTKCAGIVKRVLSPHFQVNALLDRNSKTVSNFLCNCDSNISRQPYLL